jgi:hypothetical protein
VSNRRFPLPSTVEDAGTGSAFVVTGRGGQKLAYVYYEEEAGQEVFSQAAYQRRGAPDRGQRGEAAQAVAEGRWGFG